jgi:hypothetical protein
MCFTCFHYDVNDDLVEVNALNHCPFANAVIESFPSRIWWSIVLVKEKVMKLLCDAKQDQSTKKLVSFPFSLESWVYFNRCMQICNPISLQYLWKQVYKHVHCDLTLSSSSGRTKLMMVRIDSSESIVCATNLYGLTFGIGVRNMPLETKTRHPDQCAMATL